ncbi:MAG: hypothetical protein ABS900_12410 [Candidatus Limivicinus sp.]
MSVISDFRKKLRSNPETAKLLMPGTKYEALLDLDGDGKMDFALMDTTGDGNPDTFAIDMTGNGSLNIYFFDADGDSVADSVQYYRDGTDKPSYIKIPGDDDEKLKALARSIQEGMARADAEDLIARFNRIRNIIGGFVEAYRKAGTLGQMRAAMKADPEMAKLLCDSPINELFFDLNGDGVADFALIDTNHTGDIDTIGIDLYGDGEFDLYLSNTDEVAGPDTVAYYKTGEDEPTQSSDDPMLAEVLAPVAKKFRDTLIAEFTAKNLVDALTTYKLEAIAEAKKVKAAIEAKK